MLPVTDPSRSWGNVQGAELDIDASAPIDELHECLS